MSDLLATRPLHTIINDSGEGSGTLRRALGLFNLMALGVRATIGIGVFVLTGFVSARYAVPSVVLSYLFGSVVCALVGVCYAKFASLIPIAGSAYTYSYATLGEMIAWVVGWDFILDYLFGAGTVAWGWSIGIKAMMRSGDAVKMNRERVELSKYAQGPNAL